MSRDPCVLCCTFRPFCLQPPLAVPKRDLGFLSSGLPSHASSPMRRVLADRASLALPFIGRVATAKGRKEVSGADRDQPFTADWTFASGCSPPRLTATQLPSATRDQISPDEDLHLANTTTLQAHPCPRLCVGMRAIRSAVENE